MTNPQADYDSPWKEALEIYFTDFMAFFFPQAYADINWSQGYEFLDTELQQVVRDAELGRRRVDKLVKVWRQNGEETWVLIHIEVQSKVDANFAERMYVYNYRLFDRYRRQVASLAVLADEQVSWRPQSYGYEIWSARVSLRFPTVKLLDYEAQWQSLEQSTNPFAVIIMAHLKAQATRRNPEGRLEWKL
ncbi:transposase, partial [Coleofasciculus sp. FACHB-712]|nr:transposase [Coleofasciculus sp. FACHB-712]